MGANRNKIQGFGGEPQGSSNLEPPELDEKIILKWLLQK
jgi:hypothetical protein